MSTFGQPDFRLKRVLKTQVEFPVGSPHFDTSNSNFSPLSKNPSPRVDFTNFPLPNRLDMTVLSHFPKARGKESCALDLGCGNASHHRVCEHAGFRYIGLDYESKKATLLGDAHALPFADNSIEFILSLAVLEHIRYPAVMLSEVLRVLELGGLFIGSVAFLEPYHASSYYHYTHLGLFEVLSNAGFFVRHIAPGKGYTGLRAQVQMGMFPKMPKFAREAVILPIHLLHRLWWKVGMYFSENATEKDRLLNLAGGFVFIASKPTD